PFLSAGLITWGLMSSVINEGCQGFVSAEGIIKQLPIPLYVHILRIIWRNIIIFFHNIIILPIVMLVVGKEPSSVAILSILGFFLVLINLGWISLISRILCARDRDLPQIVASISQVLFYLTPIRWMPGL